MKFWPCRARGADFQVGGYCRCVSVSQLGGSAGMLPWKNLKLKSSEMARNGSITTKSEVNF